MQDANQSVSLPHIFGLLRRHLPLIALTVILAVGVSVVLSARTETTYEARATVSFNDDSRDLQAIGIPASPSFTPEKQAAAQAERITRPDVVESVRRSLRLDLTADEIRDAVSTQVEVASNLVSITAEASTGELGARLANAFANAVRADATTRTRDRYRQEARSAQTRAERFEGVRNAARRQVFEEQAARLQALANFSRPVEVVRAASVPENPTSPKPVRNGALAGLLGLMLGIGIAFTRQAFDRRLREHADVERQIDAPVVGSLRTATLGKTPMGGDGRLSKDEDVEPFRILRTNVGFLAGDDSVNTLLVTSPLPQEGKSTVAAGLAWAEAMTGRRTLLVDCDLRRPTVATRLGLETSPGLSEFLMGEAGPAEVLRTVETGRRRDGEASQLVCIPAGRPVDDHAEILQSARFAQFLKDVAGVYDRVILDSAPLLPVGDTLALLPQVDGILLCVRLGQTTRDDALAAKAAIGHFPAKPLGLVLTAADRSSNPYYVGSYAYNRPTAQEVG